LFPCSPSCTCREQLLKYAKYKEYTKYAELTHGVCRTRAHQYLFLEEIGAEFAEVKLQKHNESLNNTKA
jgi:hypothetical protein